MRVTGTYHGLNNSYGRNETRFFLIGALLDIKMVKVGHIELKINKLFVLIVFYDLSPSQSNF